MKILNCTNLIKLLKITVLSVVMCSCVLNSNAQYCTPTANCSDGDLINNFIFNTISNLNSGGSNCYSNSYINTGLSTTVTIGNIYAISMQSGSAYPQGFGVWIDYNQDGDFDDTDEFIYASPNSSYSWFTDSIIISYIATPGTTRLRVRCNYASTVSAGESCSAFTWGETEDYNVTLQANTSPPLADFSADYTYSCNGTINFYDQSLNVPTSWFWDFGDGNTGTVKNPSHTYTIDGTYTVFLSVSNPYGSDSITKTNYITVSIGGPISASCTPAIIDPNYGIGIYNVSLNTINITSSGDDGYQDYSCTAQTNVIAGQSYSISIQTGSSYEENVRVWLDYNNDAVFDTITELIFSSDNVLTNHSGTVIITGSAVLNTSLRMRVATEYALMSPPSPCNDIMYGQVEDYSVTVLENTNPPIADFTADYTYTCNGTINFSDLSLNVPANWFWDFGDGNTGTVQNPSHTYTVDGTYTVFLSVSNPYGADSITKTNYITVALGGPVNASCTPVTSAWCCDMGIYNVTLNTINNSTGNGVDDYHDYSCSEQTNVIAGQSYSISIETGTGYEENVRVWLDYNNDAVFDEITELIFSSDYVLTYHTGTVVISGTAILNTSLRMRVASDYYYESPPLPCNDVMYGQVEDYSVIVLENTNPPIADFTADQTSTCNGVINFSDLSQNVPTNWYWDFGDGNTGTVQNSSHTYTADGTYSVSLTVTNPYGADSITKTNYITVTLGGPINAACTPVTTDYCCGMGIYNVSLNTINNSTGDGTDGYQDYSCTAQTNVIAGQSYSISIETGTGYEENVRVWLDYNSDAVFDTITELIFSSDNVLTYHTGTIIISGTAVTDTPLRMRVASDYYYQSTPLPCNNVMYGQVEDYSVTIFENTNPPIADFTADGTATCDGVVNFTDLSVNVPTSWLWDFGDGNTSSVQDPSHTYSSNGIYTVILTVSNSYGNDSETKVNYISVNDGPIPASCTPLTDNYCCGMGISNVTFNSINNTTPDGSENYQDYVCSFGTNVIIDQTYSISIQTGFSYEENVRVWIDYNNDGVFDPATELVFASDNILTYHSGTITIPSSAVVNTSLRMRVASDYYYEPAPTPCSNVFYGQVEDYGITILPNTIPPIAEFDYEILNICLGIVSFSDQSTYNPSSWYWDFGDNNGYSTSQNYFYSYSYPDTFTVTLIVTNPWGSDTMTQQIEINSVLADFFVSSNPVVVGEIVNFTDNSAGADTLIWDFGDGYMSNIPNPPHAYTDTGIYTVTLTASNTGCISQKQAEIKVVLTMGVGSIKAAEGFEIYPNPTTGKFTLLMLPDVVKTETSVYLYNILGKMIYNNINIEKSYLNIDISDHANGVYFINISNNYSQRIGRIIKL
ncbi:MAG: PKD domain-containing protein [Bacteroidota bacterium]